MDSIAVVGLACRLPGDASTPDNFWNMLCKAKSAHGHIDRFNSKAFQSTDKSRLNTSITHEAHLLQQDIAAWDANFFSINQTEAMAMDPQQRIMLEIAYEAFENAGLSIGAVAGSDTSCHVGNFTADYREMLFRDMEAAPRYALSGSGTELISNRISWFYDLRGPSFTLGTACSSSLVALHQGCQSLRIGEASTALVGGSNLILSPDMFQGLSNQQFLAADGNCKSFDIKGDGYGRGDGFAAVILKRVEDAVRDKDPIRAIIRGTGVNQDGKTKGITVPNPDAQASLIRSTYKSAGLDFDDTNYFEAHGTGTKAGDPLELEGISKTICSVRKPGNNLIVGSVKSNIGHLEATAGLAGLIKSIFILERGIIPPNINFKEANPKIPFEEWKIQVPTKVMAWPTNGLRRISVQGFGYGGTNAHAILDDAYHFLSDHGLSGVNFTTILPDSAPSSFPNTPTRQESINFPRYEAKDEATESLKKERIFTLSAQDQDGLPRQKASLATYLEDRATVDDEDLILRDLAFTLNEKRSQLAWRSFETASSIGELVSSLRDEETTRSPTRPLNNPKIGFVFTGQSAQWARMGIELLEYQVFRESIENIDQYLRQSLGCEWSIVEELLLEEDDSNINQPSRSQPICSALQIALVDLLESWNVTPVAVAGHSSGEIAAAYCLGALSREDAMTAAYFRGVLSEEIRTRVAGLRGAMLAVGASEAEAQQLLDKYTSGNANIACINSPSSVTISGDADAIDELEESLKATGLFNRRLKVENAYHSAHMDVIADDYMRSMSGMQVKPSREGVKMHSSVTGELVEWSELGPLNWVRNLTSPVLFYDAIYDMLRPLREDNTREKQNAVDLLVEIGPHAAMQAPCGAIMDQHNIKDINYLSILSRKRNGLKTAATAAGALFTAGVAIDMTAVNDDNNQSVSVQPTTLADLPPYPWNHTKTFWSESRITKLHRSRQFPRSSLLGAPYPELSNKGRTWRGFTRLTEDPWLRDHNIQTSNLFPAAGYIVMVIEAAQQVADSGRTIADFKFRDIQVTAPAILEDEIDKEVILEFHPHMSSTKDQSSTWTAFTISSCDNGQDLGQNCSGLLLIEYLPSDAKTAALEETLEHLSARDEYKRYDQLCRSFEDSGNFYKYLESVQLNYGPAFQGLSDIRTSEGRSCCSISTTAANDLSSLSNNLHPTTLDIVFHAVFAAFNNPKGQLASAMVPKSIDELTISANIAPEQEAQFKCFSWASRYGFNQVKSDIVMLDYYLTRPVVSFKGLYWAELSATSNISTETALPNKKLLSKRVLKPVTFHEDGIDDTQPSKETELVGDSDSGSDVTDSDFVVVKAHELSTSEKPEEVVIFEAPWSSEQTKALRRQLVQEFESNQIPVKSYEGLQALPSMAFVDGKHCIGLDIDDVLLYDLSEIGFERMKYLVFRCASLLWISKSSDPVGYISTGMMRTTRNELPGDKNLRTLLLSNEALETPIDTAFTVRKLFASSSEDLEFVEENMNLYVPRFIEDTLENDALAQWLPNEDKTFEDRPLKDANGPQKLAIRAQGMLDTLCLEPDDDYDAPLDEEDVEIQVKATGMNFRDVMVAMGQIPDSLIGFEASGTVTRVGSSSGDLVPGDEVCVLGHGSHRTFFRTKGKYCQRIPQNITPVEAATLPLVTCTAFYALLHIARVRKGQTILIHAAAGGVGQVAVQLANHIGLEIFATVGSDEKRSFIQKTYGVRSDHIFNSRDLSFAKGIKRMTNGRGVDCILNSLSGETLRQTWHCIAPFGSFVEIGMKDILRNMSLDMQPFMQDASFTFINLKHLMTDKPDLMAEVMQGVFDYMREGIIKPVLPVTIYPLSDVENAFRLMQMGKHRGKLAITWGDEDVISQKIVQKPGPPAPLDVDATYLLVGGLGGIGRSLSLLLTDLGAKHLAFISRSGDKSQQAKEILQELHERGVDTMVYKCDISNAPALSSALKHHETTRPPIKGVFQCAMSLQDSLFEKMTFEQWKASTRPKVQGTHNLDLFLPSDLDFFVILSSFAGLFGNLGQSNYAAANAYLDAFAQHRRDMGLKCVTVDLGAMRDVGVMVEQGSVGWLKETEIPFGMREKELHYLIRRIIGGEADVTKAAEMPSQIICGLPTGGMVQTAGVARPWFFNDPRFSELAKTGINMEEVADASAAQAKAAGSSNTVTLKSQLGQASSIGEAADSMTEAMVARVAKSLQTSTSEVDSSRPLHSYGVDSLLAVEISNWVAQETEASMGVFDILASMPITELSTKIVGKSPHVAEGLKKD